MPSSQQRNTTNSVSSILWIDLLPSEIQYRIAAYVSDRKSGLDALTLAKSTPCQRHAVSVALDHTLEECFARHAAGLVSDWVDIFEDVQVLQLHEHPPNFQLLSSPSLRVVRLEDEPFQLEALSRSHVKLERLELDICYNTPPYLVCRFLAEVSFKAFVLRDYHVSLLTNLDPAELVAACQGVEEVILRHHCWIHAGVSQFVTNLSSLRELAIDIRGIHSLSEMLPVMKKLERLNIVTYHFDLCQLVQLCKDTETLLIELRITSVLGADELRELHHIFHDIPRLEKLSLTLLPTAERYVPQMHFLTDLELQWGGDTDTDDDEELHYKPNEGTIVKMIEGLHSLTALHLFDIKLSDAEIISVIELLGSRLEEFGLSLDAQGVTSPQRLSTMIKSLTVHAPNLKGLDLRSDFCQQVELCVSDGMTWDLKLEMLLGLDRLHRRNPYLDLDFLEDLILSWPHENQDCGDGDLEEKVQRSTLELRRCRRGMNENGGVSYVVAFAGLLETGCVGLEQDLNRAIGLYKQAVLMGEDGNAIMRLWDLTEDGNRSEIMSSSGTTAGAFDLIAEMDRRKLKTLPHFADVFYYGTETIPPNYHAAERVLQLTVESGYVTPYALKLAWLVEKGWADVAPDPCRAVRLYRYLVDNCNDEDAMFFLAEHLRKGYGDKKPNPVGAREFLERGARKKNIRCMILLGILTQDGCEGVPPNPEAARDLFEQATEHGKSELAMTHLGCFYAENRKDHPSYLSKAAELFETVIAENPNPMALRMLGAIVMRGYGEHDPNPKRAVELYETAICLGDTWACTFLADVMAYGYDGVPPDPYRAIQFYERTINGGIREERAVALRKCGDLLLTGSGDLQPNVTRAAEYFRKAIDEGDCRSLRYLGDLLREGADNLSADPEEACKLYQRAIDEHGSATAMRKLARLLTNGSGDLKPDPVRAVELYRRAIDTGSVSACALLGRMFEEGFEDVRQDLEKAAELYKKGVELGDPEAMCCLGTLLEYGFCSNYADPLRAIELYNRAINEHDHGKAMLYLADTLKTGYLDKESDLEAAKEMYERGAERGEEWSKLWMGNLIETGYGNVPPNVEKARLIYSEIVAEAHDVEVLSEAMALLGAMFEKKGIHDSFKLVVAAEWYRRSIEVHKTSFGLYKLAVLTRNGFDGTPPDESAAVALLRDAVDYEDQVEPFFELADILRKGYDTVEPDVDEAERLDDQGSILLWTSLGI